MDTPDIENYGELFDDTLLSECMKIEKELLSKINILSLKADETLKYILFCNRCNTPKCTKSVLKTQYCNICKNKTIFSLYLLFYFLFVFSRYKKLVKLLITI